MGCPLYPDKVNRCLGGAIGRHIIPGLFTATSGIISIDLNLSGIPTTNFTDAISIYFE